MTLQDQLRTACAELRFKSMALADQMNVVNDFIPLLQKVADRLDQLERDNQTSVAQQFCASVFNR